MKIQHISITRLHETQWGVDGYLQIGGAKVCDTVEHPTRHLPKGHYTLKILKNRKLQRFVPAVFAADNKPLAAIIKPGNGVMAIKDCSIITATYHLDGELLGSMAVLGPTRMEYGRTMSLLNYMNNNLTEVIKRLHW